ncbi:MAG: peptidase PmbA [Chloroflexi bacterium ADurb.Bin360]|nr:MAG: peptidase PmbA [Chloroflexi bacterium ADurb.Bin360]
MLNEHDIKALLQRVISRSSGDETEVLFLGLDEALTRFANNEIHQNVAETNFSLVVSVALGKRIGMASTNNLSDAALDQLVERATMLARLQPENPDFPGFAPPVAFPEGRQAFDEATASATPELRAHAVGEVIRYALDRGVVASGAFSTSRYQWAIATSHGLFAWHPLTLAELTIVAMTETGSGYAADAAWQVAQIPVAQHGKIAVDKALASQNPRELAPGDYPVVLEAAAVHDLVAFMGGGANGMNVAEGSSWMSGRQGQALLSPTITLVDDPDAPEHLPIPFDFEGTPRQPLTIIREGVVGDAFYNRQWAAKTGHAATGHGTPPVSPFAPGSAMGRMMFPMHLTLQAGDTSVEQLVSNMERGLYVTRFNYTRPVHPREMVVTGLTRDGTFWIENGEIAYPVKNLRFTQSYVEALQNVAAVGDTLHREPGYASFTRNPALQLTQFRFTGKTEF